MNEASQSLNRFLVQMFHNILKIEEHSLRQSSFSDLSLSEMHLLEAAGEILSGSKEQECNMTALAEKLGITMGSLTVAVNTLVRKGYLKKQRNEKDRRVVLLELTEAGSLADEHHRRFHNELVEAVTGELEPEQLTVLVHSLNTLRHFFEKKYQLKGAAYAD